MKTLLEFLREFREFNLCFYRYAQKRLRQFWYWFEAKKDILVGFLMMKRGANQRPFLHSSFIVLVTIGVLMAPAVANSYPTVAAAQLADYTPPSAVLTSFDDSETFTQISEKPRDSIESYKVQAGDTLARIADRYNVSVDSIKWINTDNIKDDDKLTIGVEIAIPPVTGVVVKVKKGETIYSLAKKYKVDAQNIVNYPFNDYTDLDTFALAAGQTLVIPDGVQPEAPNPSFAPPLIAQAGTGTPRSGSGQFMWPTQGVITQRPVSYHMAVDIANNALPPILAADSGTVVLRKELKYDYGKHIIIDHGNGYQTLYGHMSEIYVQVGQNVTKGAVIGKMGSTGRSTGPHLHFEVHKGGVLLNPLNFLQ